VVIFDWFLLEDILKRIDVVIFDWFLLEDILKRIDVVSVGKDPIIFYCFRYIAEIDLVIFDYYFSLENSNYFNGGDNGIIKALNLLSSRLPSSLLSCF
jgi:hypothetical protein